MSQLNLHLTAEFERQLQKYMQIRGLHTKAEAIRATVKESLEYRLAHTTVTNFRSWIGRGLSSTPHKARFKYEDDIWSSFT